MKYITLAFLLASLCITSSFSLSTWMQLEFGGLDPDCDSNCTLPFTATNHTYSCSDGRGEWKNGALSFQDPLPPFSTSVSFIISQISFYLYGRFACSNNNTVTINATLNGQFLGSTQVTSSTPGCSCMDCIYPVELSSYKNLSGLTGYKYGAENHLVISVNAGNTICLSYINASFTFEQVAPQVFIILPTSGPTTGNTVIQLFADQLTPFYPYLTYCCLFGSETSPCAPAYFNNSDTLTCVSPATDSPTNAEVFIKILENGGILDSLSSFQYYTPPVVTSILPNTAYSGENVYITGQYFANIITTRVLWGAQILSPPGTVTYINTTCLNITVPVGSGTISVTLSQNGQQYSDALYFTYKTTPVPNNTKQAIPGWVYVVAVFGGLTFIVVILLFATKKCRTQEPAELSEVTSLLSASDSMSFHKQIDINSVKILHRIGKGTFGEVFKGIWNGTEVGVKFLTPPGIINDTFLQEFTKEVMIMRGCRHPNVLQFLGAGTNPPNICIVMEYMPLGSLYKILHEETVKLELEMLRKMMIDAARGMNYLHKSDPVIIHRDLKSHNLLVDENWKVKVCDFGLSKIMENTSEAKNMTACGTPSWTAPEILRNENYTEKADVYSFGIVMWECITRADPYEGMAPFQVVLSVGTKAMRPPVPSDGPYLWQKLMMDCWSESPDARPSFDEILDRLENMSFKSL